MTTPGGSAPSQSVRALEGLRELVLAGHFQPGERLVEGRLCDQVEVSRTPLREALIRLDADGLLERREDGYYVARYDLAALRDLYELRVVLELHGLRRIAQNPGLRLDLELLAEQRAFWDRLLSTPPEPGPELVRADETFHVKLSAASGNAAVTDQLRAVNARIRPLRMYDYSTAERVHATTVEHLAVLDCVLDGDVEGAVVLLRQHVGDSLAEVEDKARRSLTNHALHAVG
ncbi:GntR family transcriptional regulator [Dietzia cercidiphylli]|uniref:GntR family transcriptional regulator n=1 Tax=Dietzia cercidiphylli TaxID=498199 RepID=A0ABN2J9G0_9ACTN|nr:GntR family transcriptional regulator [Dietzia cercidiphylli]MBB1048308.1 GntR family transcriptional regulator [Dietzia cercidiphylli]